MDEREIFREILSRLSSEALSPTDVERIKLECCRKYSLSPVPKNSALLACAPPEERDTLRRLLLVKPTRTISGVAPIAVMTSPTPCPHGRCLPCPGGPEHAFHSPQSYTGEEPAALRAREHAYDPRGQVLARLEQLVVLGHHVDKAELIVMGGTMTARSPEYQEWFVTECIRAMNDFGGAPPRDKPADGFEAAAAANESAAVRCVATTFETRPDWCRREHVDRMLALGVTKVELGVQQIDDAILAYNRRGCTVADTVEANRLLRDSGLKVGFHVMPNLPQASIEDDRRMFEGLFADDRFRPDFLKIYPTLVTPGSEIETLWQQGEYAPYSEEALVDLIAHAKACLPAYVRLQRVQRDIPAKLIVAGSRHSNFRQLALRRLVEKGLRCRCIRCREAGRSPPHDEPRIAVERYAACGGLEHFIAAESGDALLGFARLRFPNCPHRPELDGAALLRELHVYGSMVPIGGSAESTEWQHRAYGHRLLREAETTAREGGYRSLAIMSGIGVRPYYRKQGYERRGPYMIRELA
ncbi:MAG: tRNA uridine(34) 5-carboxymethylaminomethyl modification radical SAM/GNAT enzyme Elp3 [Methanobacteriota archaeon]|nr:MAG: tRNA uridine(34) 5-carboxymethylaminomethyl modification radical SAM/GNAT enzyme Elp3 [Euryarchaeota archaeon]